MWTVCLSPVYHVPSGTMRVASSGTSGYINMLAKVFKSDMPRAAASKATDVSGLAVATDAAEQRQPA